MPVHRGGPSFLGNRRDPISQPTLCPIGSLFHDAILTAFAPSADPSTFPVVNLQCRHEPQLRVQFAHFFVGVHNSLPMACESLPPAPPMIVCVDVYPGLANYLSIENPAPTALAAFVCHYLHELYPAQLATANWERTVYTAEACE